jgi:tetratricopeptide (TPR) repeat protein
MSDHNDVLEQNVSTLIEAGGEPPRLSAAARARIRAELVANHGVAAPERTRSPLVAVGIGLVAAAAVAMIAGRFVGGGTPASHGHESVAQLGDGTTYLVAPGAKVTEIGNRHVRVEGEAMLDVVPGKGTFVVDTAQGRIEVLGTKFVVDATPQRTLTAVVRGSVKLATDDGSVILHAGEQGVAEHGRVPVRGPAPRLSHLASWAREARQQATHAAVHHGTLFARDPGVRSHPPWGEEYPLPIAKLGIDVTVEDQVARVAIDQTFRNNTDQALEGVYRFAIPSDAALQRLAMYVDGNLMESAVVERMQARRIYEELVYRRVDPALLEWAGTGRLSLRVYPIPAHQDKRLMVAYTESLPKLYTDWTLAIPLPEVEQAVGEIDVAMRVKGCANCELSSPSHKIDVERSGDDAVVRYRRTAETIGDTFVVHVRDSRGKTTVATDAHDGGKYLLVRAPAELGSKPREYRPRTWVLLDDVSASRSALELRAQQDLIDSFLGELDENDKVSVVAFDVQARQKLAPTRVLDVDRRKVRAALDNEGGVGATDFAAAIDAAMRALDGVAPDDAMIVYVGDGVITSGSQKLDELRAKITGKAHFIGVGVGDGPDTQTLRGLADATGGYATAIDLSDDLSWRAFDLIAALHTTRVTGISARLVDARGALVPATLYLGSPQLADGEEIEAVAKLAGDGTPAALELTGTLDGAPWQRRVELPAPRDGAGYLPRMWAQRHIAARLLAKHEAVTMPSCTDTPARGNTPAVQCPSEGELREARDETIRKEVVALGKQYFLLSRHTSLLVLENDAMYAQYGVTKGAGDTWAPYTMPATIPVVALPAAPMMASDVDADAELLREPIVVFYQGQQYGYDDLSLAGDVGGGFGFGFGRGPVRGWNQGDFRKTAGGRFQAEMTMLPQTEERGSREVNVPVAVATPALAPPVSTSDPMPDFTKHADVDTKPANLDVATRRASYATVGAGGGAITAGPSPGMVGILGNAAFDGPVGSTAYWNGGGMPALSRLSYPQDPTFDDLTAFVPALLRDASDSVRASLREGEGTHTIDDAAKRLLADARDALPAGVYRWGDYEIAIDNARHIGWRHTTEFGLVETASYDGKAWTRRYAELGLDATRNVADDDIAIALAYFPLWIAEPAHYAKYFDVKASGRTVTLSRQVRGQDRTSLVLHFDSKSRVERIEDGNGRTLVEVTWQQGPATARVGGNDLSVGFIAQPVGDATQWAHAGSQPGIALEVPTHLVPYCAERVKREAVGTPSWRAAQRQLMVALAAMQDRAGLVAAFESLYQNGGVEKGDLALASSGFATAATATDEQFRKIFRAMPDQPILKYIDAYRRWAKTGDAKQLRVLSHDGLVGALWGVRSALTSVQTGDTKQAMADMQAIPAGALELRIAAATMVGMYGSQDDDVVHIWDGVAVGRYRNTSRAAAAQALLQRGRYDAAADAIAKLVDDLDLGADPVPLAQYAYAFQASRRGQAGWEIVQKKWRDRVLAGTSFAHVMSLLAGIQDPGDGMALLQRAAELAGDDPDRKLEVAKLAVSRGQGTWAESIVRPILKQHPTRALYQLVASLELQQGKTADALADLEAAQSASGDETVNLGTARAELSQIIALAAQLALQSLGAERQQAVDRALAWGTRWRAIDPGNQAIDQQLGDLLLAVGDTEGAWRQLSSAIERDPWSSSGYMLVAESFERQGKVEAALPYWQQAIIIDQTNPTPRLRKAQALIALGRADEGDKILAEIDRRHWHDVWSGVVYQAKDLLQRGKTH